MKRLMLLPGALLAGMALAEQPLWGEPGVEKVSARVVVEADTVVATPPRDISPIVVHDDHPPTRQRSSGAYGEFLYMTARGNQTPYALIQDAEGPLGVPVGAIGIIDSGYSPGARVGIWRSLSSSDAVHLGGSYWRNETRATLAAQTPNVIRPLAAFDPIANATSDSLDANATLDVQFATVELDLRHTLCATECFGLNLIVGGRYAHLDQDFRVDYSSLGGTTVTSNINFDGAGPRIGLDGQYAFGQRRAFVYGRSDVTFLVGHFGSNYRQETPFALQVDTFGGDDRMVPVFETEVGLGWKSRSGRLEVTAGYTAAMWFNTMTTPAWIQGVQNTNFSTNGDNLRNTLTFDGLFLRAGFKF